MFYGYIVIYLASSDRERMCRQFTTAGASVPENITKKVHCQCYPSALQEPKLLQMPQLALNLVYSLLGNIEQTHNYTTMVKSESSESQMLNT